MDAQILELVVDMIKTNKVDVEKRLEEIDSKLDELLSFKWRLAGMTAVLSLFGGVLIQVIIAKMGGQ